MDRANFNFQYKTHKGVSHMRQLLYEKKHRLIATMVQAQSYQNQYVLTVPRKYLSQPFFFFTLSLLLYNRSMREALCHSDVSVTSPSLQCDVTRGGIWQQQHRRLGEKV